MLRLLAVAMPAAGPDMMQAPQPVAPLAMPEDGDFGVNQLAPGDPQYDLVHRKFMEGMVGLAGMQIKNVKIYEVEAIATARAAFEATKQRIVALAADNRLLWHGTTQLATCKFGRTGEDAAGPCSGGLMSNARCNVCSIARVSFQQGKVSPSQIRYKSHTNPTLIRIQISRRRVE